MPILMAVAAVLLLILIGSAVCFKMAFYQADRTGENPENIIFPEGEIYGIYRDKIEKWTIETRNMPHTDYLNPFYHSTFFCIFSWKHTIFHPLFSGMKSHC